MAMEVFRVSGYPVFNWSVVCPKDKAVGEERFRMYRRYYAVKYSIAKMCQPTSVIEIGVRAGYSAWAFMMACRPGVPYYGFDAENGTHGGRGGPWTWWARKLLEGMDVPHRIYAPFNTQEVDRLPEKADFYHVDGDHTERGVYHDLEICFGDLPIGGHILIDDYDYSEAKDVRIGVNRWLKAYDGFIHWRYLPSLRGEILIQRTK